MLTPNLDPDLCSRKVICINSLVTWKCDPLWKTNFLPCPGHAVDTRMLHLRRRRRQYYMAGKKLSMGSLLLQAVIRSY